MLVTDVAAPAIIVNIPSALVSSSDTLVAGRDPVEMNTVAADEVECTPRFMPKYGQAARQFARPLSRAAKC